MKAGRPATYIPSQYTVSRDIKILFEISRQRIDKLLKACQGLLSTWQVAHFLQDHKGKIHFATDAWTSPNHFALVAWTVHLHHEGHILTFLLDIYEVPEVGSIYSSLKATYSFIYLFS
jgi:hypothetical protein